MNNQARAIADSSAFYGFWTGVILTSFIGCLI